MSSETMPKVVQSIGVLGLILSPKSLRMQPNGGDCLALLKGRSEHLNSEILGLMSIFWMFNV